MPSRRPITSAEPAAPTRGAVEAPAKLGDAGSQLGCGDVHHVLGVALDHRHRRLQAVEQGALLGLGERAGELAPQQPATTSRGSRSRTRRSAS